MDESGTNEQRWKKLQRFNHLLSNIWFVRVKDMQKLTDYSFKMCIIVILRFVKAILPFLFNFFKYFLLDPIGSQ